MSLNFLRTALLLAALSALFVVVGAVLGGPPGVLFALLLACSSTLFTWWNADRLALTAAGAEEIDQTTQPRLTALVRDLSRRAGLPMPRLFIVRSEQPNAFATGRDPEHAAIAVHTGLLNVLSEEELAGVLAHELAHIRNRDTLTMTVAAALAGAISAIAHWGWFAGGRRDGRAGLLGGLAVAALAPLAAMVVRMAVNRGREYEADRLGAQICGNPRDLARALRKLADAAKDHPEEPAERQPAMAHLYTVNPLGGRGFDDLFSTHPSLENRVAALDRLASTMGLSDSPARDWAPFRNSGGARGVWGMGIRPRPARNGPWG